MRIVINNKDRISGTDNNFTVQLNPSPEDMQKDYHVYIQQSVLNTSVQNKNVLLLSSNNLNILSREYNNSKPDRLLCCLEETKDGVYNYSTNDSPNFKIKGVPQQLHLKITDASNVELQEVGNYLTDINGNPLYSQIPSLDTSGNQIYEYIDVVDEEGNIQFGYSLLDDVEGNIQLRNVSGNLVPIVVKTNKLVVKVPVYKNHKLLTVDSILSNEEGILYPELDLNGVQVMEDVPVLIDEYFVPAYSLTEFRNGTSNTVSESYSAVIDGSTVTVSSNILTVSNDLIKARIPKYTTKIDYSNFINRVNYQLYPSLSDIGTQQNLTVNIYSISNINGEASEVEDVDNLVYPSSTPSSTQNVQITYASVNYPIYKLSISKKMKAKVKRYTYGGRLFVKHNIINNQPNSNFNMIMRLEAC